MKAKMLLAMVALLLVAANREEVLQDLDKFTGTWQAVSIERDGEALPKAEVQKVRLVVNGENYTFQTGRQIIQGKHKLDPSKDPKMIDAVRTKGPDKGKTLHGIYELDGDTLRICFSKPEHARPSAFRTGEDAGHRLLVFNRVK